MKVKQGETQARRARYKGKETQGRAKRPRIWFKGQAQDWELILAARINQEQQEYLGNQNIEMACDSQI